MDTTKISHYARMLEDLYRITREKWNPSAHGALFANSMRLLASELGTMIDPISKELERVTFDERDQATFRFNDLICQAEIATQTYYEHYIGHEVEINAKYGDCTKGMIQTIRFGRIVVRLTSRGQHATATIHTDKVISVAQIGTKRADE